MQVLKKRLKNMHCKVVILQIWCDCRTDSIPKDLDDVFDFTLTRDRSGDFNLDGNKLIRNDSLVGYAFVIDGIESYENVRNKIGLVEWIILDFPNWKMIPVENAISECEGTGTKIAVVVDDVKNINGIAFALEKGVDAIIIKSVDSLIQVCSVAKSQRLENDSGENNNLVESLDNLQLTELTITKIDSGGVGERYCVDLICLISQGEGMLIGSSSSSMALVHGEVIESEFVPARPFRVNAGPPHSYILMANGKTKYLSELQPGDDVMLVSENGSTRSATVGRLKIEKRPFLQICWENDYQISNSIFLQQAETVRILSRVGVVNSVTNLEIGDTILCHESDHTRHIGNKVSISSKEV